MSSNLKQLAVRWYPPSFDVRVEEIEVPGFVLPATSDLVTSHSAA